MALPPAKERARHRPLRDAGSLAANLSNCHRGTMGLYLRPTALADALSALADDNTNRSRDPDPSGRLTVLAGGTDFYPAQTARTAWLQATPRNVLDISGVEELKGIRQDAHGVTFGALATWSDIRDADLPPACGGLQLAAREVGGVQVQNRGTIAGNICNASPAADGVPPLLTLDASVEIASLRGVRALPLADFITGNRATALARDELVASIRVPPPPQGARATFLKLGARSYLVISIVSVAMLLDVDARGRIAKAAISVGACSTTPVRLRNVERELIGASSGDAARCITAASVNDALSPIDDVRGSARYRREAALVLVRRALGQCLTATAVAA
jgi:CO/xanthine dehydrogenase FAD-binding subunit